MRLNQVTIGAHNMPASIAFYETLGLKLIVLTTTYARFELPEGGATFSLHHALDIPKDNAPVIYFECDDLDAEVARLKAAGIAFASDPTDQSWLWREAHLRDPSGNLICLYHAGANRTHPPWRLPAERGPEHYHIVILENGLKLVKHDGDWRVLQDRYANFKTSLGPMYWRDAMAEIEVEWPQDYARSEERLRAFRTSDETELDL